MLQMQKNAYAICIYVYTKYLSASELQSLLGSLTVCRQYRMMGGLLWRVLCNKAELQIIGGTEDDPEIIFLISQGKHMLSQNMFLWRYIANYP